MRRAMPIIIALMGAYMLSAPAVAGTPSSAADGARVVCKERSQTTTRFRKRTCLTRAEWEALAESAKRRAAEEFTAPRGNVTIER